MTENQKALAFLKGVCICFRFSLSLSPSLSLSLRVCVCVVCVCVSPTYPFFPTLSLFFAVGKQLSDRGVFRGALECYTEGISNNPSASLFNARAQAYKSLNMWAEAYVPPCVCVCLCVCVCVSLTKSLHTTNTILYVCIHNIYANAGTSTTHLPFASSQELQRRATTAAGEWCCPR